MIENDGTMVHIDFGFIFGDSPGFNINFENAPFKLTKEYVDLMGGRDSPTFKTFQDLFVKGFLALSRQTESICAVVDLFYGSKRRGAVEGLRKRLHIPNTYEILRLIETSFDNLNTKMYDWYQFRTNQICQ